MSDLKTYLIAGASSGIGLALAQTLLQNGHAVIGMSRHPGPLLNETNYSFLNYDFSQNEIFPQLDTALSGVIYCPGSIRLKPIQTLKREDLGHDFALNVLGAFSLVQHYLPQLRSGQNPAVLFFSSVAAQIGMPYHVSVAVSKAAVEGLTRSLAADLAPGIRVNCIAPSLTDTPLAAALLNSESKRTANAQRHPLQSVGTVEEMANAAAFLLDSRWITGQILSVNGGLGTVLK